MMRELAKFWAEFVLVFGAVFYAAWKAGLFSFWIDTDWDELGKS